MKIRPDRMTNVDPERLSSADPRSSRDLSTSRDFLTEDSVEISPRALDLTRLDQAVRDLPEVRGAAVAEIQSRITAGTYSVSGEKVAASIMEEEAVDKTV